MLRERIMAQDGPTNAQMFFKLYAERERRMRMEYMETLYIQEIQDDYPIDEEAPLDLPQTTCIVIEPIRNLFACFL
jgi:hypothetical protein